MTSKELVRVFIAVILSILVFLVCVPRKSDPVIQAPKKKSRPLRPLEKIEVNYAHKL